MALIATKFPEESGKDMNILKLNFSCGVLFYKKSKVCLKSFGHNGIYR